jgi:hypothetical protein
MPQRLKSLLALWFVLQIVLPFTAPLQTCDLRDLLGTTHRHGTPVSSESSATPLAGEARLEANTFVSPLTVATLPSSTVLAAVCEAAMSGPFVSTVGLSPSLQVQHTVLRL